MDGLACQYGRAGRKDEAVQLLEETVKLMTAKLGPDQYRTLEAIQNLADAYSSCEKMDEALHLGEEVYERKKSKLGPDHPDTLLAMNDLAVYYGKVGRWDEALRLIEETIRLNPNESNFHNTLCAILLKQGKYAEAEAAMREAIRIRPNEPNYHDLLGVILLKQDKYAEAEAAVRELIRLRPDESNYHNVLGLILHRRGKYAEAEVSYREAIRLQPNDAKALNALAWLLAACPEPQFRDATEAVELARKAVENAPKEAGCWFTLGVAQYRSGDFAAAIESLQKAGQMNSGEQHGGGALFLAMAHWQLGDKDKARNCYDQAVRLIEKNAPNYEGLVRFRAEAAALLQLPTPENKTQAAPKSDSQNSEPSAPNTDTPTQSPQEKQ